MKCGLLGRKLGHSYSPQIHSYLGDYSYERFEKEPDELQDFLMHGDFTGINVTIPYKKDVIPYLDELTPIARKLGAVNTIVHCGKKLIGHNTDYFGFRSMLAKSGLSPAGKKCLVLGSGGASSTVCSVLQELGAEVIVISRSGENNYENLHLHADAAIIVNTTPVGMYPDTGKSAVELHGFPALEGVLDVIYNPARTKLLLDAESRGLVTMNGLWMLVAQAKEAAQWFSEKKIPDERIGQIHDILKKQMENIILIGMPGCGKSTVGKLLAERTGKRFVDIDREIEYIAGKPIPQIFAEDGETVFREWESTALYLNGRGSGLVLSTGGGCVTRQHNYPLLHQNGTIFWLQRDLSKLATDGRPLSQQNDLGGMYAVRAPLYHRFADHIISNDGSLEATVAQIMEALK